MKGGDGVNFGQLFEQMTKDYLSQILGWAVKKTGNRDVGEELTQEVFSQFFSAVSKADCVEKPENLLWKVAHYCWCNHLRKSKQQAAAVDLNESIRDDVDFVDDLIHDEMKSIQISSMRREISNLSRLQREAIILHYLDGLSVAETARRLNTTESAVTWHLFDARKKVKKEIENMDAKTNYLYRPGRLSIGVSGDGGPNPDTKWVSGSLIRQNLCLLCYCEAKTLDDLVALTSIPKPYLEFDLDWLVAREFMTLEGKKYSTAFPIISQNHMREIDTLYRDTKDVLIDRVIDYLWEHEKEIRGIGFYGADFPTERLMWAIITMFISFVSRNSPLLTKLKRMDDRPIRPDGGKYIIMAADKSTVDELYPSEILWGGYSGIWSDSCIPGSNTDIYYWLGVNTFANPKYHPEITRADAAARTLLHWIYSSATEPWFNDDKLEPHGKEALAEAIADGLIEKKDDRYAPKFVVFTTEQLEKLREDIYRPLLESVEPVFNDLGKKISSMHKADFPKIIKHYADYHTYIDLWDFGIYTLMYAAQAGKLWMPETPEQGTPLTLVIVK
jgi:RNA polymerase sigma factor (sigma-70 family)